MKTVGEYVTHASRQLNDQRPNSAFTRWGRGLLWDDLELGLGEIATYRPEAFATEIDHPLVPGSAQSRIGRPLKRAERPAASDPLGHHLTSTSGLAERLHRALSGCRPWFDTTPLTRYGSLRCRRPAGF